jgi:hypothetical protein
MIPRLNQILPRVSMVILEAIRDTREVGVKERAFLLKLGLTENR